MSIEDTKLIDALTEEIETALGPVRGIAVLSSVICQLYEKTDKTNAMVLAQPYCQNMVITATFDSVDRLQDIVGETIDQIGNLVDHEPTEEEFDSGIIYSEEADEAVTKETTDKKKPTVH